MKVNTEGFKFNDYDPCVANRVRHTHQQTIRFHVDDVLVSSKSKKANDEFYEWCNQKYGDIKKVKCHRGGIHQFLGMTLDFESEKGVRFRVKTLRTLMKAKCRL